MVLDPILLLALPLTEAQALAPSTSQVPPTSLDLSLFLAPFLSRLLVLAVVLVSILFLLLALGPSLTLALAILLTTSALDPPLTIP